ARTARASPRFRRGASRLGQVPAEGGPRAGGARGVGPARRPRVGPPDRRSAQGPVISAAVRPRGPFSLRLSARHAGDATRTKADGPFTASLASGGIGRAWQQADGVVQLRAPDEAGVAELRFVLALDD